MKAIILARVSTEEQREQGNSLPAQIDRLKSYCKRQGFEIAKTYSFDESAYKNRRDEFDKILEDIKQSKEPVAVCFDKVDRLSRNIFDKRVSELYQMALSGQIELHFASDNQIIHSQLSAGEKTHFGINLVMAKYYSDAISDNVKRANEKLRRDGVWPNRAPLGYLNIIDEHGKKDITPDTERAPLVLRLFEEYSTGGYSITKLHDYSKSIGFTNRFGKHVKRSAIDKIIRNTFYVGMAPSKTHGAFPHKYHCIISHALFNKCIAVREDRHRKPSKLVCKPFMFQGMITCDNCGCLYSPELKTKKSGKQYIYYSCTNSKGNCKKEYVNEKDLLKPVYKIMDTLVNLPESTQDFLVGELKKTDENQRLFHKRQMSRMQKELSSLQTKIERVTDLFIENKIAEEVYKEKINQFKKKQHLLTIELEEHNQADHRYHIHLGTVMSLARRVRSIFDSSDIYEKQKLVRYLIQNPTINKKKLYFTIASPFNHLVQVANSENLQQLRRVRDSNPWSGLTQTSH
jgi:site-specific DNA recombinase